MPIEWRNEQAFEPLNAMEACPAVAPAAAHPVCDTCAAAGSATLPATCMALGLAPPSTPVPSLPSACYISLACYAPARSPSHPEYLQS